MVNICAPQAVIFVLRRASRSGALPECHREAVAEYLRSAEQNGGIGVLPAPWGQKRHALSAPNPAQAREREALSDSESGPPDMSDENEDPSPALADMATW